MKTKIKKSFLLITVIILFFAMQTNVFAQEKDKGEKNWLLTGNTISGSEFIGTISNNPFILKTNNLERLRITSSGNVGIGVINPSEKLEIFGGLKLNTITPGNSANGTIIFNGTEFLVRKNNQWMSLVYKSPWDTTNIAVYTGRNVGVGVDNPKEKLEINGAFRLLKMSRTKDSLEDGTIFYDGNDLLAMVNGEIDTLTDGGTTPPPITLWAFNQNSGTVYCLNDKVAIGGNTTDANLHLMNRLVGDLQLKMRFTHTYEEIQNQNQIDEEPLTVQTDKGIIKSKSIMTKDFDIFSQYGNMYFYKDNTYLLGLSDKTLQCKPKFVCNNDVYVCNNVRVYGGNGCSPSSPIAENFYVNGTSKLTESVSIGDATHSAHLSVTGHITVGENIKIYNDGKMWVKNQIKVNLEKPTGWGDFIFEPDYKLKPLSEVEAYVKEHKHLEGIPSANELVKDGIDLGAMTNILTQKVEEMTLYMIEMNKTIELLKKENEELKKEIRKTN